MSRVRTRAHILNRVKRYGRYGANADSLDDDICAMADDVAALIQGRLAGSGEGYYKIQRDYPMGAAGPTLDLDPNFQHLTSIIINPVGDRIIPAYGSPTLYHQMGVDQSGRAQYYELEGPGLDWVDPAYVAYPQRLRFTPSLDAGDVVSLTWTIQPISLADTPIAIEDPQYTDRAQDATISFDWVSEPILQAATAYIRVHLASRDDDKERAAATSSLSMVLDDYLKARAARNMFDVDNPSRHARSGAGGGGPVGY